jgi:hypothetical protein
MWSQIAEYFDVEPVPFDGEVRPLESRMQESAALWKEIASRFNLVETDIAKLASWWHTDADLGRPMEVVTDMAKSRKLGFLDFQPTDESFFDLFDRLKAERIIP